MTFLRFYYYNEINNKINDKLRLSKRIKFLMGPRSKENPKPYNNLALRIIHGENESLNEFYEIDLNNDIIINSLLLSEDEVETLICYIKEYGKNILDYQLQKITYNNLVY